MGPPLRVLNISAPFRFALRYSVSFFYIPSRSASRPASRFACRSCVSPCVPLGVSFCVFCLSYRPCVSSFRFAFHACPWAIAFDMGTVLPCSPLTLPCRLSRFVVLYSVPRLAVASRPACVPFCVSFVRLALRAVHSYRRGVSFCVPFSLLVVEHDPTFVWGAVSSCLPLAVSSCVSSVRVVFVSPCVSTCVPILYAVHASHPAYCSCVPCRAVRFRLCVPTCVSSCIPLVGLPVGDGI